MNKINLKHKNKTAYPITITEAVIDAVTGENVQQQINKKQDSLVSGKTIKTINGDSILGEGNIELLLKAPPSDLPGYVTEEELNAKNYATQDWVTSKNYLTNHQDISNLALKSELEGLATETWVVDAIQNATGINVDTFDPTITYPTDQLSFKQMVDTCIEFNSPIMVVNDKDIRYIKNDVNNIWFNGKMQAGEDKLSINLNWDIDYKDVQVGQQYTLYIPDGCIKLQNGSKNNTIYKTYTYVAEDSIPDIMPLSGQVTTNSIKTTTLYFETPIESFDPENVRYVKPFGSVWCGVAGSYTISENRLSMIINWDFAPEIGVNYTLELPEGCILFADGTKNIETNVIYSVTSTLDPATYFVPNVTGSLKTTIIKLDSPISSFDRSVVRLERQYGNIWGSVAGYVKISEDKLTLTINWDFVPENGVTYTLVLPSGCIILENGNKNEEFRVSYTN